LCPKRIFGVCCALVLATGGATGTAGANRGFDPKKDRETLLLSRSLGGGFPNGPSRNGAFSQDRQLTTLAAYESDASNIVAGDTNGATDVFLVRRRRPYDLDGPPWRAAGTELVSRGLGGAPANGPSYEPDLDGEQRHRPSCIAFVSDASNLVPDDTNGEPDAFVKDLRSGTITRVSVGSSGQQANGPTYEVKVDGECQRVAFSSGATNLALTDTERRAWSSAVTPAPPAGPRQVYVRILGNSGDNRGLEGLTFLASAAPNGQPGDSSSYEIAFARSGGGCPTRCGDFSGEAVFFTSKATNLSTADTNGQPDVYKSTFTRRFRRLRYPRIKGIGRLRTRTRLISTTRSGRAGNGPSRSPATHDTGRYVAFVTEASDIVAGDHNRVADIVRIDTLRRGRSARVSESRAVGELGNGNSGNPTMGRPGSPVFFDSAATNLQPNPPSSPGTYHDRNGSRDVFFWNIVSKKASLQSRDSSNSILNLPSGPGWAPAAPALNPATSYYGNYLLFETSYPLVDLRVAKTAFPGLEPGAGAAMSWSEPKLHQVYLRYIGPRKEAT
jgi:TolB protein